MYKRREFLTQSAKWLGATLLLPSFANAQTVLNEEWALRKVTILHTNDTHSRIEPFPMDGGKLQGRGGAARRAYLINQIRQQEENLLLLDAGDIFQGTPYFNYFKGEIEIKLMSQMGYDAAAIGNHDFDGGLENLKTQINNHANFPLICANYNFKNTALDKDVLPYKIFNKAGLKIGVFGLGVKLDGLVPKKLYLETEYQEPLTVANQTAQLLKQELNCDFIIALSHLGYSYKDTQISDLKIAAETQFIDLIIGGHTHTFLDKPTAVQNKDGKEVFVSQAGWAGVILGRIDIYFERGSNKKCMQCLNQIVE
jgi:5'-nucleotidase